MEAVIGVIAFIVTLVGFVAAAGHAGYLAMLTSAAKKRPGGQAAVEFTKKRYPVAGVALGVTVLALLISNGSIGADIFAILLGGGGGVGAIKSLQTSQKRLHNGEL